MNANTSPHQNAAAPGKPKHKIVYAFLLVLAFTGLAPLATSAYKLIGFSREALVTSQQEAQLTVASSVVRQLNAAIESERQQLVRLAEAIAAQPRAGAGTVPVERGLFDKFLGSDLLMVRYTPRAGAPVEAAQPGFPRDLVNAAIRDGVRAALGGKAAASDPVPLPGDDARRSVLVVTVPVGPEGGPVAALTGVVDVAAFWDPVVGGRRSSYLIYALDRQGRLFAAQDEDGFLKRHPPDTFDVVQEFRNSHGYSAVTSEFTLKVDGVPVEYIASFDTTDQGWGIFAQLEKKQAYAMVNQMIQTAWIWASAAMVLALVLAYVLAANVTRPIDTLVAGAEAFSRSEFDHRVRVKSRNELGLLADTFNAMADQLKLHIDRLREAAVQNHELFMGTVRSLAAAIDEKDPYTRGHSDRVSRYAVILAKQLGLSKRDILHVTISSLFHDIGKIGIEDKILRKPSTLTEEEYTVMKQHPEKGAQMLSKIKLMKDIIPGLRFHHERWDGSGYPLGLKGEAIPMAARIVGVADAFDAMTTNRPYQKAMSFDKAIQRLFELSDKVYDRRVVSAFSEAYKAGVFKEPEVPAAYQEL